MKKLDVKTAIISALMAYVLGVSSFVGSYFVPLMADPDLQANLALMLGIIPAAGLGAHYYYRKGHQTHGFVLGALMFLGAMILDALITVPLLVIPNGGDYSSFFGDPGFWLIGLEYISVVVAYWLIHKTYKSSRLSKA